MLWAVAKALPATTFPIAACIPAAIEPDDPQEVRLPHGLVNLGKEFTADNPDGAEAKAPQDDGS